MRYFLCGCRCDCVYGCMGVILAVNVEAVEGRNISIMTVHLIDPRSDVL